MYRKIIGEVPSKIRHWMSKSHWARPTKPYPIYPDDVFFVSYPRSGSSWLRRLIATALNPQSFDEAYKNINALIPDMYVVGPRLAQYSRPRMIKSHELYEPLYPTVVYLYRDARDVAVSYYNFYRTIKQYGGTLDEFLRLFVNGDVDFGKWDNHVRSWLIHEHPRRLLTVAYEGLHQSTGETVSRVMEFLGHSTSNEAIQKAVEQCTFNRHQEHVKRFSPYYSAGYRGGVGGQIGRWREILSNQQATMLWNVMAESLDRLGYQRKL